MRVFGIPRASVFVAAGLAVQGCSVSIEPLWGRSQVAATETATPRVQPAPTTRKIVISPVDLPRIFTPKAPAAPARGSASAEASAPKVLPVSAGGTSDASCGAYGAAPCEIRWGGGDGGGGGGWN